MVTYNNIEHELDIGRRIDHLRLFGWNDGKVKNTDKIEKLKDKKYFNFSPLYLVGRVKSG